MRCASSTLSVVLRQVRDLGVGLYIQSVDVFHRFNKANGMRRFAHRTNDLIVPFVTNKHNGVTIPGEANRFGVYLRHQRTGGIDRRQLAISRQVSDLR